MQLLVLSATLLLSMTQPIQKTNFQFNSIIDLQSAGSSGKLTTLSTELSKCQEAAAAAAAAARQPSQTSSQSGGLPSPGYTHTNINKTSYSS